MAQPTTGVLFSGSFPPASPGNQLVVPQTNGGQPAQYVTFQPQLATTALNGVVKPDGTTITIDADGTIHAPSVGGGGTGGGGTSASSGFLVCVVPAGTKDGSNTQFTLPAPVFAGSGYIYVRNGVTQRQLGTKAEFAVQGTQLTTSTPLQSDDWHEFYYVMGTPNSESGGGGSVTPSGLRGTSSVSGNATTITIPIPVAAQVGDFAILFGAHAYNIGAPSGWTNFQNVVGLRWNGFGASKILSSGDITAGSVTLTAAGASYGMAAMAVFAGATGGIRESHANSGPVSGAGTDTLSTTSGVLNTDIGIYFGSVANGAAPTVSQSPGATLESMSNAYAAGIMASQSMPGGVTAETLSFSDAAIGMVHFIVIVEG